MRLSEAIRLGSMLKPQAFNDYYRDGGSCAIGAAFNAIGKIAGIDDESQEFPLIASVARCPECGLRDPSLGRTITHLNDSHEWTRERIADFVETLEAAQAHDQPASERCGTTAVDQPVLTTRA